MSTDPFGTESLRTAVLASWADSPTRFREDANAEEDLLLGGYADRWLVELAQNAADAARRAGEPGRLLVRVVQTGYGPELRVANTGAPLDAAGVTALASLRASAKRDGEAVGRFGVGFAAVLGVTDQPRIVSRIPGGTAGVRFSREWTAEAVAELPGPAAEELARRDGRPPVLRLCWPLDPGEPEVPDGYATEVRLPVTGDLDAFRGSADTAAPDLLLALPWLVEVSIAWPGGRAVTHRRDEGPDGTVELSPGGRRWRLVRRSGRLAGDAAAGRAVEEHPDWTVCWALPVDDAGQPLPLTEDVLHAPTPSDERLSLPARLLADLPMQPTRRRVRTGPATDAVLAEAALGYLDLVLGLPPEQRLHLVPAPGFPLSELDSALRSAIRAELADSAWLPSAAGKDLAPRDGVLLEWPGLADTLVDVVPGLLADGFARPGARALLTELGVRVLSLSGLADQLAGLGRPPSWWQALYDALVPAVDGLPTARDELAALPVPLVDGRLVTGPRTAVALADVDDSTAAALAALNLPGLRVVHPDAAHPLLVRLGATEAGPAELLDQPAVREAVEASVDEAEESARRGPDLLPLARLVLGLLHDLAAGPDTLATRPWLAALALPDSDGAPARADELMLPDAAIAPLLVDDAPVGVLSAELTAAHPRGLLTTVGVLDSFAVVVDDQPTGPDHDLPDEDDWWDSQPEDAAGGSPLVAVRDLDLVNERRWPAALALLASDRSTRRALLTGRPAAVHPGRPDAAGEPYTTWWLSRYARLNGHRPSHWRLPSATGLAGLFDPLTGDAVELDTDLLAAIGVRRDARVRDTDDAADLLDRLADPDRAPSPALTWAVHADLAAAVLDGRVDPEELAPPERLRAVNGAVVDAEVAVLLDRPWLAPTLPDAETVGGRFDPDGVAALAALLDLPLASEVVDGRVPDDLLERGDERSWAEFPEVAVVCAALGAEVPTGTARHHERLVIELKRPEVRRMDVPVWPQGGAWHFTDAVRALVAAGLHLTRPGSGNARAATESSPL